jgi:cardiolipin synthase
MKSAWVGLFLGAFVACGANASKSTTSPHGDDGGGVGDDDAGGASGSGGSGGGSGSSSGSGGGSGSSSGSSSGSGSGGGSGSGSGGIVSSTGVTILVYPNGNHAAELIAAIKAAKTSVYMTMYEIDDSGIVNALVAQKAAKLDVQVILDGSTTTKTNNTSAYNSFTTAQIPVVWSNPVFTFTHEKCVMIDHKQAWIMTANAESSVPEYNREYLAIDNDQADVTEAEAIFTNDHAMQSFVPTGDLVVANNNARPDLVALINSAKKSVDVEDEEFSDIDSNGITDAIEAAAKRNVTVRVIVAGGSTDTTQTTALTDVKNAGGTVYVSDVVSGAGSASDPYIHAKTILVDCATGTCVSGFVGSENMTTGSLEYNRELGVILTDATQLGVVYTAVSTDFANPKNTKM